MKTTAGGLEWPPRQLCHKVPMIKLPHSIAYYPPLFS